MAKYLQSPSNFQHTTLTKNKVLSQNGPVCYIGTTESDLWISPPWKKPQASHFQRFSL
jgi:hypothetical protein